jgi:hypothetical protein
MIVQPAAVTADRISATISLTASQLGSVESASYLGFAFMFDPAAKLPLRLLQFVADIDAGKLKEFAATCH